MLAFGIVLIIMALILWILAVWSAHDSASDNNDAYIIFGTIAFVATILGLTLIVNYDNGRPIDVRELEHDGVYELIGQGKSDGINYAIVKYLGDGSVRTCYFHQEPLNGKTFKVIPTADGHSKWKLVPWSPSE